MTGRSLPNQLADTFDSGWVVRSPGLDVRDIGHPADWIGLDIKVERPVVRVGPGRPFDVCGPNLLQMSGMVVEPPIDLSERRIGKNAVGVQGQRFEFPVVAGHGMFNR